MSTRQILITGATGYIGGDALHAILKSHPHLESTTTCLVRNPERSQALQAAYPRLTLTTGSLTDSSLLESLAADADIVLHLANIEDAEPARALARGLQRRTRAGPAFWICASGTDNLTWETIAQNSYGEGRERVYDDLEGIAEVLGLPADAPHRDVEAVQQEATRGNEDRVKLAIVCAPCIYGVGRGCGNRRSIQIPNLARYTIDHGKAFYVGSGLNRWPNVHVHDLSDIFVRLVSAALVGGGEATWGLQGYYFAENGEHVWGEVAGMIAREVQAQGFTESAEVVSYSAEEADREMEFGALFYGTDSRCRASRARKVLSWVPQGHGITEEIREAVTIEGAVSTK